MEQVIDLLFGSWTGQLTLLILLFMLGMMGYLAYVFLQKPDQSRSGE